MSSAISILMLEAVAVYLLVLGVHSLRLRAGLGPFYALLGGITAVMSWVTDAGVQVQALGVTFMVGSTVFYTALILGVFVVYVFDGPRSTRMAIFAVAGVSSMAPVIAAVLHAQMKLSDAVTIGYIPIPSLRINTASVLTTIFDLIFLAMAWEFLGKANLRIKTWLRAFLTLLGVMWFDVLLFATGAFAGTPHYLSIMQGTLLTRLVISVFAFPFLYIYLNWQNRKMGAVIENRPVLAILKEVAEVRTELDMAKREIDRRRRAEAALRESEEKYRLLAENMEAIPWEFDIPRNRWSYVAPQAQRILGYAPEEWTDLQFWTDRIHEEDREWASNYCAERVARGEAHEFEYRFLSKGGNTVWLRELVSVELRDGKPVKMRGFMMNITERRKVQEEYQTLFREMLNGFALHEIVCDEQGVPVDYRFLAVNPAFERMTGLRAEDIVGKTALEVLPNTERHWIETYGHVALSGEPVFFENYSVELEKHFEVTAFRPAPKQFACIFLDVSERKRAEQEREELRKRLFQAQKAESLGRMAGAVAHHFNNQLTGVMGYLELAIYDLPAEAPVRESLAKSLQSARRASEVSTMMLAYLGQSAGKTGPMDLSAVCRSILPPISANLPAAVSVKTSFPEQGPVVQANEALIRRVLSSLTLNAAEAIDDRGGDITVVISVVPAAQVQACQPYPQGWEPKAAEYACLAVTDTGCGMAPETLEKVFDPFFSTKFTGRGLGMPLVLGMVKALDGAVAIDSHPGRGTTVRIFLPLSIRELPTVPKAASAVPDSGKDAGLVLLVDDEPAVRRAQQRCVLGRRRSQPLSQYARANRSPRATAITNPSRHVSLA